MRNKKNVISEKKLYELYTHTLWFMHPASAELFSSLVGIKTSCDLAPKSRSKSMIRDTIGALQKSESFCDSMV